MPPPSTFAVEVDGEAVTLVTNLLDQARPLEQFLRERERRAVERRDQEQALLRVAGQHARQQVELVVDDLRMDRLRRDVDETRPWLPHLTVLRFRERPRLCPPLPETGTFVPSGAAAYLSRLHPTGARYEVLVRVSLIAGG